MKKVLGIVLILALVIVGAFAITGCKKADTYEIALITDVGNIDDMSFNQGTWEGVKAFAEEKDITYKYYRPSEDTNDARVTTIEQAITAGAKVVVCPGYLFETAIFDVQDQYPEVKFILLDGTPNNGAYDATRVEKTAENTTCILYKEEQAGYLAGYAAVMEGYRSLGFIGGMAVPAVVRYGYGFVEGADDAAAELGLVANAVSVKFDYAGSFGPSAELQTKMDSWYKDGVEVIFSCGGGICSSVFSAAADNNAKSIGVDVDQSNLSDTVITSAMKGLAVSVQAVLEGIYSETPTFAGGETTVMGAAEDAVGLPTATWSMTEFTEAEYTALFEDLADGTITVNNQIAAVPTPSLVNLEYLYVEPAQS